MWRMHGIFINRDVTSTMGGELLMTNSSKVVCFMSGMGFLIVHASSGECYYTILTVPAL